jgi:hypothetical protein
VWGELVILAIALAAVSAVVARSTTRRRREGAGPAPDVPSEGTWTAAGGPLEAAFPLERTPRERDIGDAAFVDGFVIGRYYAPEPGSPVDGGRRTDEVASGLAGDDEPAWVDDGSDAATAPSAADLEVDDLDVGTDDLAPGAGARTIDHDDEVDGGPAEDTFDDAFGFDDGFDDDW